MSSLRYKIVFSSVCNFLMYRTRLPSAKRDADKASRINQTSCRVIDMVTGAVVYETLNWAPPSGIEVPNQAEPEGLSFFVNPPPVPRSFRNQH